MQVAELIRWLTAANPRDRPSMREVLRSELLPPTVGDEQLTDLLRSLPDKYGTTFCQLKSCLDCFELKLSCASPSRLDKSNIIALTLYFVRINSCMQC